MGFRRVLAALATLVICVTPAIWATPWLSRLVAYVTGVVIGAGLAVVAVVAAQRWWLRSEATAATAVPQASAATGVPGATAATGVPAVPL
jgi:hypothetical protein